MPKFAGKIALLFIFVVGFATQSQAFQEGLYSLYTNHGKVVCAELECRLSVRDEASDWEIFFFEAVGNGRFYIKTAHGKYLKSSPDGVLGFSEAAKEWEQFEVIENSRAFYSIKSVHGKFLSAQPDGTFATRDLAQGWEKFLIVSATVNRSEPVFDMAEADAFLAEDEQECVDENNYVKRIRTRIAQLERELAEAEDNLVVVTKNRESLAREIVLKGEALNSRYEARRRKEGEVNSCRASCADVERQQDERENILRMYLAALEGNRRAPAYVRSGARSQTEMLEEVRKRLITIQDKLSRLINELDSMTDTCNRLGDEIQEIGKRASACDVTLSSLQARAESLRTDLRADIARLDAADRHLGRVGPGGDITDVVGTGSVLAGATGLALAAELSLDIADLYLLLFSGGSAAIIKNVAKRQIKSAIRQKVAETIKNTEFARPGRAGAFRQAKRDAGIPVGTVPVKVDRVVMTNRHGERLTNHNGELLMTREYYFKRADSSLVVIQDHSAGHKFGDGGKGDQGPHFNVRPVDPQKGIPARNSVVAGTLAHYSY